MKRKHFSLVYLIALILFSTCSKDDEPIFYSAIEADILKLINEHRLSLGLNALSMNAFIYQEAVSHSNFMIENSTMSHEGFSERAARITDTLGVGRVGENVAYGYSSAEAVVEGWLNSDGHRRNIENPDYNLTGISASLNDDNRYYFTQIFFGK